MLLLSYAGKDCTQEFYSFHRQEVLQKYKKLKIGSLEGSSPTVLKQIPGQISKVPYGEASAFQGFHSPYYNQTHKKFRVAVREFYENYVKSEAEEFDGLGKPASREVFLKMGELAVFTTIHHNYAIHLRR